MRTMNQGRLLFQGFRLVIILLQVWMTLVFNQLSYCADVLFVLLRSSTTLIPDNSGTSAPIRERVTPSGGANDVEHPGPPVRAPAPSPTPLSGFEAPGACATPLRSLDWRGAHFYQYLGS